MQKDPSALSQEKARLTMTKSRFWVRMSGKVLVMTSASVMPLKRSTFLLTFLKASSIFCSPPLAVLGLGPGLPFGPGLPLASFPFLGWGPDFGFGCFPAFAFLALGPGAGLGSLLAGLPLFPFVFVGAAGRKRRGHHNPKSSRGPTKRKTRLMPY